MNNYIKCELADAFDKRCTYDGGERSRIETTSSVDKPDNDITLGLWADTDGYSLDTSTQETA